MFGTRLHVCPVWPVSHLMVYFLFVVNPIIGIASIKKKKPTKKKNHSTLLGWPSSVIDGILLIWGGVGWEGEGKMFLKKKRKKNQTSFSPEHQIYYRLTKKICLFSFLLFLVFLVCWIRQLPFLKAKLAYFDFRIIIENVFLY